MAYDQALAIRIQSVLQSTPELRSKQMFGGICYLVRGNMVCGILGEELIVRVGPARYAECLARPNTRVFDFTGRPMVGWVLVGPAGFPSNHDLSEWIQLALVFVQTLPAKR